MLDQLTAGAVGGVRLGCGPIDMLFQSHPPIQYSTAANAAMCYSCCKCNWKRASAIL